MPLIAPIAPIALIALISHLKLAWAITNHEYRITNFHACSAMLYFLGVVPNFFLKAAMKWLGLL